ncbi:LamG domain-containing protein [Fodinicola feengrottensis]|uniref:LamG domain-containing protein n=1 Tax=Fodinicola feengrottensis TaxID=435914 RepID=UPI0013D125E5|nr:LamG domain-containing protein [Fodinicola feengrottensis]
MPDKLASPALSLSAELWFKTTSSGVLLGQQNTALTATPTQFVPVLYVGTDGKLRGQWWQGGINPITSAATVNDGNWHHAVISGAINTQTLYLDGVAQGTLSGLIDHQAITKMFLGTTRTTSWPSAVDGYDPFTGTIDDVAIYWHPLGATGRRALRRSHSHPETHHRRPARPPIRPDRLRAHHRTPHHTDRRQRRKLDPGRPHRHHPRPSQPR